MGKTTDPASLFRSTSEAANQSKMQQVKLQRKINKAKHRFIWWAGIMFTLFPVLVSFILGLIVESTQDSAQALKNYGNFILGFFTGGSFLWLSITLLGTSLLELFLFGFKKSIDPEEKFNYIKLIVSSIVVGIIAIIIYVVNIGSPIKATTMIIISVVSFLLFAKSSHIVSFKFSGEQNAYAIWNPKEPRMQKRTLIRHRPETDCAKVGAVEKLTGTEDQAQREESLRLLASFG